MPLVVASKTPFAMANYYESVVFTKKIRKDQLANKSKKELETTMNNNYYFKIESIRKKGREKLKVEVYKFPLI